MRMLSGVHGLKEYIELEGDLDPPSVTVTRCARSPFLTECGPVTVVTKSDNPATNTVTHPYLPKVAWESPASRPPRPFCSSRHTKQSLHRLLGTQHRMLFSESYDKILCSRMLTHSEGSTDK